MEKKKEEREGVGYKLAASFDTKKKKVCGIDKWTILLEELRAYWALAH